MKLILRNAANALTLLRLLLAPAVVYALVIGAFDAALWTFLAASLSDGVDGYIARRFHQRSHLGAVLDPLADKLLILGTVLALAWIALLPVWLAVLIAARDAIIIAGAVSYRVLLGTLELAPTWLGKASAFAQFTLVVLTLFNLAGYFEIPPPARSLFFAAVALLTVASGLQYVWIWGRKAVERGRPIH